MKPYLFIMILVFASAVVLAGCVQQQQTAQPVQTVQTALPTTVPTTAAPVTDTIKIAAAQTGNILVDAQGMTLYYFASDTGSGSSACYGTCAGNWPAFSPDTIAVSPPLQQADFSSVMRTDGTKQVTYKGWPLYHFKKDAQPGDMNGEGVLKIWFVARPDYTVMIANQPKVGSYLTDSAGKTLYFFLQDSVGASACNGACLQKWPPFYTRTLVVPSLLHTTDFSSGLRTDGVMQTLFTGRPLYYFSNDKNSGDITGHGFNNAWAVANTSAMLPVFPTPTPTPLPTTIPTSSYGSDSGGGGGGGY